jgi:hypothetical protein
MTPAWERAHSGQGFGAEGDYQSGQRFFSIWAARIRASEREEVLRPLVLPVRVITAANFRKRWIMALAACLERCPIFGIGA